MTLCVKVITASVMSCGYPLREICAWCTSSCAKRSRGRRGHLPPTEMAEPPRGSTLQDCRNHRGSNLQDYLSFLYVLVILAEARIQLSRYENRALIHRLLSLQRQLVPRFREGDGLTACHFRGRRTSAGHKVRCRVSPPAEAAVGTPTYCPHKVTPTVCPVANRARRPSVLQGPDDCRTRTL